MTPVLIQDGRALQMTPVNSKDGQALPELTISRKTAGPDRQPTVLQLMSRTDALPGRPYQPRPGRKGLLDARACSPDGTVENTNSGPFLMISHHSILVPGLQYIFFPVYFSFVLYTLLFSFIRSFLM